VSKQFAAAAILLLSEKGSLYPDDPIGNWLTRCRREWQQITIHNLLTHTSGVGHWDDFPDLDLYSPIAPAKQLSILQRAPLRSLPGRAWRYSSPGYVLLARIVEQASGQSYASFLTNYIIEPLNLHSTSVGEPRAEHLAACGHDNGAAVSSFDLRTACTGAGDIWSTTEDLARFNATLCAGSFLTSKARQAMFTAHALLPGLTIPEGGHLLGAASYGYGWYIGTLAGHPAYFHPGDNPGYQALNVWLPQQGTSIAILVNEQSDNVYQLLEQLLPSALGRRH
jgi:CubicO group peptidase (beta-lactamase class C family)